MVHPSTRSRRFSRAFEHLETRRLLAVDLVVEHDAIEPAEVGDMVTRTIRVHNLGDEVARDTLIRSSLTSELVDPVWERYEDRAKFISRPRGSDFQIRTSTTEDRVAYAVSDIAGVGDINGDGLEDFVVERVRKAESSRRWETADAMLVLGEISEDFDIARSTDSTVIVINNVGNWPYAILPLGDVNGDGFDDLAVGGLVVLGWADIGAESTIDIADDSGRSGLEFSQLVFPLGDLDADGVDDFVLGNYQIVFGDAEFRRGTSFDDAMLASLRSMTIECGLAGETCAAQWEWIQDASSAGDINGDGFQDAFIGRFRHGVLVVFGGPSLTGDAINFDRPGDNGFVIPTVVSLGHPVSFAHYIHLGFNVHSGGRPWEGVRYIGGNDFDGDGIDDLLVSILGAECHDCDTSAREGFETVAGAAVVFGSATIGAGGQLDEDLERIQRFEFITHFYTGKSAATSADVNHDGRPDIVIASPPVTYAVSDVSGGPDVDFGFVHDASHVLTGQNGFGRPGEWAFVDINRDGFVDEVNIREGEPAVVYLSNGVPPVTARGTGDIQQVVDVAPGTRVEYTVRGRLRDDAVAISSTAISSPDQRTEDKRDNIVSPNAGVLVDVGIGTATIDAENVVEFDVAVSNIGPMAAESVAVSEAVTHELHNVEWTRRDAVFPSVLRLSDANGPVGASFSGPTRAHPCSSLLPTGYETQLFTSLGYHVGSLGDVNGDGYDDIYAAEFRHVGEPHVIHFHGSADFGGPDGIFPEHFEITQGAPEPPQEITGDINGDGYADRITGDPEARGERGETYVTFGTPDGIPTLRIRDLDGTNGFVIRGDTPDYGTGHSVAAGDINNDGFDDLIIGESSHGIRTTDRDFRHSFAHVIYGRPTWPALSGLEDLDGYNGFKIDAGRGSDTNDLRGITVASDLDVNGDGIDDVLIGNVSEGAVVFSSINHGAVYVIFGRQQTLASGTGPISEILDLPFGAEVTYSVRGVLPEGAELAAGTMTATVSATQIDLDPRTNTATLGEVRLLSDLDSDGTVGFSDYLVLASNFGESDASREQGDLNGDGTVDLSDFIVLARQFGGGLHE